MTAPWNDVPEAQEHLRRMSARMRQASALHAGLSTRGTPSDTAHADTAERNRLDADALDAVLAAMGDAYWAGAEAMQKAAVEGCGQEVTRHYASGESGRAIVAGECINAIRVLPLPFFNDGWRLIATAPQDGTNVLVYAPPYEDLPAFQSVAAWHPDAGWCVCLLRVATHWRPLPVHPADRTEPEP